MRYPFRFALTAAALAGAASLVSADNAAAGYNANYPYCVQSTFEQIVDCSHVSLQECRFSANGMGYCFANPFFRGAPAEYIPHGRRHRY